MRLKNLIILSCILTGTASCQNPSLKTTSTTARKDTVTALNAPRIYILKQTAENSDFNYFKLNNIDSHEMDTHNIANIMPVFEPKPGTYKYFQFLSTFIGEAYNADGPPLFEEFHDILIIKTDSERKIIDAYQYTLEWGERPYQYDVFRSSTNDIVLTDGLDISKLKFLRTEGLTVANIELKQSGTLRLK